MKGENERIKTCRSVLSTLHPIIRKILDRRKTEALQLSHYWCFREASSRLS